MKLSKEEKRIIELTDEVSKYPEIKDLCNHFGMELTGHGVKVQNSKQAEILTIWGGDRFCFIVDNQSEKQIMSSGKDFEYYQDLMEQHLTNNGDLDWFERDAEVESGRILEELKEENTFQGLKDRIKDFENKIEGYYDGDGNLVISSEQLDFQIFTGYTFNGITYQIYYQLPA